MAASLNQFTGLGNLTRDPELSYTPKGTAVANLGIAINSQWKDADGNKKEDCTFLNLVAFGKTAEATANWMCKGTRVLVEGRLSVDEWEDKRTKAKRTAVKIVVNRIQIVDKGKPAQDDAGEAPRRGTEKPSIDDRKAEARAAAGVPEDDEEQLPF